MTSPMDTIIIRPAEFADIPQLFALNQQWLLANVGGNTSQGFLSGAFTIADFEAMITARMIVVALDNDEVVAYMLSMNHAAMGILEEHVAVANNIKQKEIIPSDSRVAVGVQTAVQQQYHGTGLIVSVRKAFLALLKDRFDYLFTTISKENVRSYHSATKFGWQVVGEHPEHYYLVLQV
jgi:hypothetical protein